MNTLQIASRLLANYLSIEGRPLPSFLIIGAQKAGTSSLFQYLSHHPSIHGGFIKEIQYFTRRYHWGVRGYRSFFPKVNDATTQGPIHVGEATPFYLFDSQTPARVKSLLPGARLIVLLREPVERAYSHYKHNVRRGHEKRSFEEAVTADIRRFEQGRGITRMPGETVGSYRHHSYVRRGLYALQLENWLRHFSRKQMLLLRAEDFFANPAEVTDQAVSFLGLPLHPLPTSKAHNQYAYEKKDRSEFASLVEFFEEPNRLLASTTGISWS